MAYNQVINLYICKIQKQQHIESIICKYGNLSKLVTIRKYGIYLSYKY